MELVCWHCAECAGGAEGGACAGVRGGAVQTRKLLPVQRCRGRAVQLMCRHCAECAEGCMCTAHCAGVHGCSRGRAVQLMCRHCLLGASHPGPLSVQPLHWAGPTQSQLFTSILFNMGFIDFGYMGSSETLTRMTSAKYKKQKVIFRDICDIPTRLL